MRLLVSPQSIEEAQECISAGVDIIDVKNPAEGSLGANYPWVIKEIRAMTPAQTPISATVGDVSFKPGTVALAAYGAALSGASFVKVGLFDIQTVEQGTAVMEAVRHAVTLAGTDSKVVAAGYAEGETINSLDPLVLPKLAHKSNCDFVMLDTFDKSKKKAIFDILSDETLQEFVQKARKYKLGIALGGSIIKKHLSQLKKLQIDIVGVRGAVCTKGDRMTGKISSKLILDFAQALQ